MRAKIEQLKKKGQGLVEYALILVLIAIVVIVILTFLGNQVGSTFSRSAPASTHNNQPPELQSGDPLGPPFCLCKHGQPRRPAPKALEYMGALVKGPNIVV